MFNLSTIGKSIMSMMKHAKTIIKLWEENEDMFVTNNTNSKNYCYFDGNHSIAFHLIDGNDIMVKINLRDIINTSEFCCENLKPYVGTEDEIDMKMLGYIMDIADRYLDLFTAAGYPIDEDKCYTITMNDSNGDLGRSQTHYTKDEAEFAMFPNKDHE